jgi:hypothetical protein
MIAGSCDRRARVLRKKTRHVNGVANDTRENRVIRETDSNISDGCNMR